MSHFTYNSIKNNKDKIGVWLRPYSNDNLVKSIKKIGRVKLFERIERIIIVEKKKNDNRVFIEVWLNKITFGKNQSTIYCYRIYCTHCYNLF